MIKKLISIFADREYLAMSLIVLVSGIFFIWLGYLKFYPYEAGAVSGLMSSNPLTSWLIALFGKSAGPAIIGSVEIVAGLFLLVGLRIPLAGFLGAGMMCASLVVTTTMFLTVPVFQEGVGFPALSGLPGQFLAKDPVMLGGGLLMLVHFARRITNR